MQIAGGWGGWGQGIPAALHPTGRAVAVPHHRAGTRAAPSAWRLSCHGSVWGTPLLRGRSIPIMAKSSRSHPGTSLQSPVPLAATVPSASCPHPPNPARRAVAGYCIWAVTNKNDINMLLSGGWEGCPEEQSRSVGASCPCQELGKWLPSIWPDHRSWGKRKDEKLLSPSNNQTGGDVRDLSESQFPSLLAWLPLFSIIFSGPVSTGQRYTSEWHCTGEGYPSFESEKLGATRCQSLAPFHWAPLSFSSTEAWGARWPPGSSSWRRNQGAGEEWAHEWSVTATAEAWDVYPEQAWEVCRSKNKTFPLTFKIAHRRRAPCHKDPLPHPLPWPCHLPSVPLPWAPSSLLLQPVICFHALITPWSAASPPLPSHPGQEADSHYWVLPACPFHSSLLWFFWWVASYSYESGYKQVLNETNYPLSNSWQICLLRFHNTWPVFRLDTHRVLHALPPCREMPSPAPPVLPLHWPGAYTRAGPRSCAQRLCSTEGYQSSKQKTSVSENWEKQICLPVLAQRQCTFLSMAYGIQSPVSGEAGERPQLLQVR